MAKKNDSEVVPNYTQKIYTMRRVGNLFQVLEISYDPILNVLDPNIVIKHEDEYRDIVVERFKILVAQSGILNL